MITARPTKRDGAGVLVGGAIPSASEPLLAVRGLSKSFDGQRVLWDVGFDVHAGEAVALMAENGAGKSTLLDIIAGVQQADTGAVSFAGKDGSDALPMDRGLFYVPQSTRRYFAMKHPALYCYLPECSVRENLLSQATGSRFAAAAEVDERLDAFGLAKVACLLPAALSVGQQQRLALARALGSGLPVLLLDEPMASVDRPTRLRLLQHLASERNGRALVYVTHDPAEAAALGARTINTRDLRLVPSQPAPKRPEPALINGESAPVIEQVTAPAPPSRAQGQAPRELLRGIGYAVAAASVQLLSEVATRAQLPRRLEELAEALTEQEASGGPPR